MSVVSPWRRMQHYGKSSAFGGMRKNVRIHAVTPSQKAVPKKKKKRSFSAAISQNLSQYSWLLGQLVNSAGPASLSDKL